MTGAGIIEAVVQVGAEETRYLRCGRGADFLVVLAEDTPERMRLIERFAAGCCVIAPVQDPAPATPEAVEEWLRGVIDGLGLDRPRVVLSAGLAGLAGRLVDRCGDAVSSVIAVPRE